MINVVTLPICPFLLDKADQASKASTPMISSESSLLQGEPMDTGEKPSEVIMMIHDQNEWLKLML